MFIEVYVFGIISFISIVLTQIGYYQLNFAVNIRALLIEVSNRHVLTIMLAKKIFYKETVFISIVEFNMYQKHLIF